MKKIIKQDEKPNIQNGR
jgi:hypothetical protein